jgi:SAM-dependent methyltransferase
MKAYSENMKCENWIDYWSQDDFWRDSFLWEINSRLFFKRASRIIEFKKTDCVLDIGCGPGYSEIFFAPLVKSIYAVDVARQFVDICSDRCRNYSNVSAGYLRKDDYTNLEECKGPFSVIFCVSVVQYYRNMNEIEVLISSVKKIASPGARMLIADMPLERGRFGFIWDAFCSYLLSIRHGYTQILLRTALKRWFRETHYKSFYDKAEQLYFTKSLLESLISRLNLNASIIRGDFSVYANRLSLLIQF